MEGTCDEDPMADRDGEPYLGLRRPQRTFPAESAGWEALILPDLITSKGGEGGGNHRSEEATKQDHTIAKFQPQIDTFVGYFRKKSTIKPNP
jgi:hypothetical protein